MTENASDAGAETKTEDKAAETAVETAPEELTMTDHAVERFGKELESDGLETYKRWGFALFHTLDDEKAAKQLVALGIKPRDGLDHYNLGCGHVEAGKFAKAAECFAKAIELDDELNEARFNLALALEKTGDLTGAKKHLMVFLEACEDADESAEVRTFLGELANR